MNIMIIVLDGFGIGAMPDAGKIRSSDLTANTALSLATWTMESLGRPMQIPYLASLGLEQLDTALNGLVTSVPPSDPAVTSVYHRVALGYPGADTFAGHQTMMGADMSHVRTATIGDFQQPLLQVLRGSGHKAEPLDGDRPLIVVDDTVLVHDNLEADPRLNWNVSGRLTDNRFEEIEAIAHLTRQVAPVGRVIAVGGHSDEALVAYVREGPDGTLGMDTPASGFYRNGGLQVLHLGADIDHRRQLPEIAAQAGADVTLVGKAADILETDTPVGRHPGVETRQVLDDALDALQSGRSSEDALSVVNVQQTDLAGHQQDPARYVAVLEEFDRWLGSVLPTLEGRDLLLITADHGNDPMIGHAFHTREYVPCLVIRAGTEAGGITAKAGEPFDSLATVGASCASLLGLPAGAIGHGRVKKLF